jgi:transposase
MKQHRNIPDDYKLKSVTVSQNASGKYFASILFEYEEEITEKNLKDLSVWIFLCTNYMLTTTVIAHSFRDITDCPKRN